MTMAQNCPPRYQIVDLGDLRDSTTIQGPSYAFGINDDNVVVGMAENEFANLEAFVWLPNVSKYGLGTSTAGVNDVDFAVESTTMWPLGTNRSGNEGQSVAYDINEDGWVVGNADYDTNLYQGFLWNPTKTSGSNNADRKSRIDALVGSETRAQAVTEVRNDGSTDFLIIAGITLDVDTEDTTVTLDCLDSLGNTVKRGYSSRVDLDPGTVLTIDDTTEIRQGSVTGDTLPTGNAWSMAVANFGTDNWLTAGTTSACGTLGNGCGELPAPVFWANKTILVAEALQPPSFDPTDPATELVADEFDGRAYDLTESGEAVGRTREFLRAMIGCEKPAAAYWVSTSAAATDLHVFVSNPSSDSSCAFAINSDTSTTRVVGMVGSVDYLEAFYPDNPTTDDFQPESIATSGEAYLWEYDTTAGTPTWVATRLQDKIADACDGSEEGQWRLIQAFDVNANGWIVGHGERELNGTMTSRAFLLIPIDTTEAAENYFSCPADIVPRECQANGTIGNGVVNIDDLMLVINEYALNVISVADVTPTTLDENNCIGNGDVNIDDLVFVLNNYGTCGSGGGTASGSLALQLVDFSSGWMDETGTIDTASATAVATAWATFDASWDVYRVWVEVPDSSTYIDAVSGSEDNNTPALITNDSSTYYNNSFGSDFPPNPALFATSGFETLAFDTFLTIGNAGSAGGNPSVQGTIDLTGDTNSKSVGWYRTGGVAPVAGGSTGWRVLVGQFSVPDADDFCISLHITGDGIDEYATVCSP
jgi:probable HAF family extracellular repeat protein